MGRYRVNFRDVYFFGLVWLVFFRSLREKFKLGWERRFSGFEGVDGRDSGRVGFLYVRRVRCFKFTLVELFL